MTQHSLFKYYTERRWAEQFLKGKLLFRSLSYFRDTEDENIRGDKNEGNVISCPEGGLVVNNQTRGTTFTLSGWAFESRVKQNEIFVFCMSRSLTDELWKRFSAVVCIEIFDVSEFCSRIEASLPPEAKFPNLVGGRRARVGQAVVYYPETGNINPRWALPDQIAISKHESYAWQNEYRLVFSLTGALEFENVDTRLVRRSNPREPARPLDHRSYEVNAQGLSDICRMHEYQLDADFP